MCRTLSDRIGGPEKGRLLFQASLKLATFLWVFRQLVFCHFSATLDHGLHLARHRGCEGVAAGQNISVGTPNSRHTQIYYFFYLVPARISANLFWLRILLKVEKF